MAKKNSNNFNRILIIAVVAIFLVIAIFWNIDRRRRIFAQWRRKIGEIRELRRVLAGLYTLKTTCDNRVGFILWIVRALLVGSVFVGAQWLHYEYGHVWYLSLGYSLGVVTMAYKGIMFLFFANKYGVTETMIYIENRVQNLVYGANSLDTETIKKIEQEIEQLEQEAMILKLQLRPEAQVR